MSIRKSPVFQAWVARIGLSISICYVAVGCGGSGSSGGGGTNPPSNPTPLTAPTITPASGTYTTAQSYSVTGSGGTVHCTLDGSTPSSSSSTTCSGTLSTNGTTTIKAYVAAPVGSTTVSDSSVTTATVTIAIPVTQTISLPATMNSTFNSTIVLDSSIVTASSSCSPSSVNWSITLAGTSSADTDTTVSGAAVLASYVSGGSSGNWGTVKTGNAPNTNNNGTYNLKATCGSVSATTVLTVLAAAPTFTNASPNTCAPSSCTMTFTGTNFSAINATASSSQWQGTLVGSSAGACPAGGPAGYSGGSWQSPTQFVWGYVTSGGGSVLGPWNVTLKNSPTKVGTDGGKTCTENAYTVTATGHSIVSGGTLSFHVDPETGAATVIKGNAVVATLNLGVGAEMPVITETALYAIQPALHAVAKIDLQSYALMSVPLGDYTPTALAADKNGMVYAKALSVADPASGAIFGVSGGFAAPIVASADTGRALALTDAGLVGVEPSSDGKTAMVHVYSLNGVPERAFTISVPADSVAVLSGGVVAYRAAAPKASVLDLNSFRESGIVRFQDGIMAVNGGYVGLSDGTIGSVAITVDGTGMPQLSWRLFSRQDVADLYNGFAVASDGSVSKLYLSHRSGVHGKLLVNAASVPVIQ